MQSNDRLLTPELKNCFLTWAQGVLTEEQIVQNTKQLPDLIKALLLSHLG